MDDVVNEMLVEFSNVSFDIGEAGVETTSEELATLVLREAKAENALRAYVDSLRAAVRAADAMAAECVRMSEALPDPTPNLDDAREKYAEARAKCGEVT